MPIAIEATCPLHIQRLIFLQLIVEDCIFGKVVQPFKLHTHGIAVQLKCFFLLSDIHGTTMFHLEPCCPPDDNNVDDNANGASDDDSDADYTPSLSDMEESSDDDEDGDGDEEGDDDGEPSSLRDGT